MSEQNLPSTTSSPDAETIVEKTFRPANKTKQEWQEEEMVRTALNLMRRNSCDSFKVGYADEKIDVVVEVRLVSVKRTDAKAS